MKERLLRSLSDYGMLLVLIPLCAFFSWQTIQLQIPDGANGGAMLVKEITSQKPGARVLIAVGTGEEDLEFARTLQENLKGATEIVSGSPADVLNRLRERDSAGEALDYVACNPRMAGIPALGNLPSRMPGLGAVELIAPDPYYWPNFLKMDNLGNISGQISIIAIIAIGMTFVIIAGGIDLSVGSLIALSSVAAAWLIREAGGESATVLQVTLGCLGAVALCGLVGAFSGSMISFLGMPAFIVTLGVMQTTRGAAQSVTGAQTISETPTWFTWLGRDADLLGIPNSAALMLALYLVAHVVLAKTRFGRHVYAVGGNAEAARLSGVPVQRVVLLVYVMSGALAGLGGIVMASQLESGSHTYGVMFELMVIAAVVVGGTSLSGGEGSIPGTLIGALVIGVIQNGMNLMSLGDAMQQMVLGGVILIAVLLDQMKKRLHGFWASKPQARQKKTPSA